MSRVVEVPGRELRGEGAGGTVDVGDPWQYEM
jgi:hypothetical protein